MPGPPASTPISTQRAGGRSASRSVRGRAHPRLSAWASVEATRWPVLRPGVDALDGARRYRAYAQWVTSRAGLPRLGAVTGEEIFRAQARDTDADSRTGELRRILTHAKLEAIEQVAELSEAGLGLVIPGLHQQLHELLVDLVDEVGAAVAFAFEVFDEQRSGASISVFKREVRDLMTQRAVELKQSADSARSRFVAEVLAQRLAWRHSHEFLSWLAFRRDDQSHDAADRLARLEAFKVKERLLKSRAALSKLLGAPMAQALEAHDRFALAHRWPEPSGPEAELEALNWRLLAYRDASFVEVEMIRTKLDHADDEDEKKRLSLTLEGELLEQLADALAHAPAHALAPGRRR